VPRAAILNSAIPKLSGLFPHGDGYAHTLVVHDRAARYIQPMDARTKAQLIAKLEHELLPSSRVLVVWWFNGWSNRQAMMAAGKKQKRAAHMESSPRKAVDRN